MNVVTLLGASNSTSRYAVHALVTVMIRNWLLFTSMQDTCAGMLPVNAEHDLWQGQVHADSLAVVDGWLGWSDALHSRTGAASCGICSPASLVQLHNLQ